MKKTMKWLGALALMMMCAFSFTACGDDDDDPNPSGSTETTDDDPSPSGSTDPGSLTLQDMLVGNAWYIVYEGSDVIEVNLYLFNSNGMADAAELERSSDDGFTTTRADRFTVNYSIAGNRLTIVESDGDTRVAQLDITNGTSTTMRPVKSDGTLGDAETIYLLAKGKTAEQLVAEGLVEQLMDRLTAERRGNGSTETTTAFQGAKRIFGSNLVKAYGREGYDRYTVTYDANGFVTKVHRDRYDNGTIDKTEEVTITYSGSQGLASTYKNGTFAGNTTFTVGSNGFVSSVIFTDYNTVMYYDSDGHMTKLTASESGRSENMTWNWQDGDIVTAYWDGDTPTSISYTDANHSTPVTNVSGVIEWDHIMGIDMDDDITYFTGAMGYGPKHLPLAWTDGSSSATVTWTLDSQGRAVKAVVQETGEYNNSTKTFFWEY